MASTYAGAPNADLNVPHYLNSPFQNAYNIHQHDPNSPPSSTSEGSTPSGASPISPSTRTHGISSLPPHVLYQSRQLRPPKSPLYIPAALRPTEPPSKHSPPKHAIKAMGKSHSSPPTPPHSAEGEPDTAESLKRLLGDGFAQTSMTRIVTDEWKELEDVQGAPTREHWKVSSIGMVSYMLHRHGGGTYANAHRSPTHQLSHVTSLAVRLRSRPSNVAITVAAAETYSVASTLPTKFPSISMRASILMDSSQELVNAVGRITKRGRSQESSARTATPMAPMTVANLHPLLRTVRPKYRALFRQGSPRRQLALDKPAVRLSAASRATGIGAPFEQATTPGRTTLPPTPQHSVRHLHAASCEDIT